eukprot:224047-Chlamydomonas_euryale.AAC.1
MVPMLGRKLRKALQHKLCIAGAAARAKAILLVHQLRLQTGPDAVHDDEDVELGPHIDECQLPEVVRVVEVPWFCHKVP